MAPLLLNAIVLSGGSEKVRAVTRSFGRRKTSMVGPNCVMRPLRQRRGVAAEQQRLERLGRRIDEDRAGRGEDPRQLLAQFLAQLVVEIGERLVEQHEVGVLDDGARQRRALLLAAGKLERRAVEQGVSFEQRGRLAHPRGRWSASVAPATRSGEAMFS